MVHWSVELRTMLRAVSILLPADSNPAEHVNGIPVAALKHAGIPATRWASASSWFGDCDAVVAHQADFDKAFVERHLTVDVPWICTREDVTWPKPSPGESLTAIALAHGVAIVAAHRALNDCLALMRLLEAVPDIDERLAAGYEHAKLPKLRMVSLAPFEQKDIVKEHGFKWDSARKQWWRVMAREDAEVLPFDTKPLD